MSQQLSSRSYKLPTTKAFEVTESLAIVSNVAKIITLNQSCKFIQHHVKKFHNLKF